MYIKTAIVIEKHKWYLAFKNKKQKECLVNPRLIEKLKINLKTIDLYDLKKIFFQNMKL